MKVYRIAKREYIDDLSGMGAGLYGGRWNPKGFNMLYTSGSISLASLEFMAHNYHVLAGSGVVLAEIEIGLDMSMTEVKEEELSSDWNEIVYNPLSCQKVGSDFLTVSEYYILKVPSTIVPQEFNYLLNPSYKSHAKTRIHRVIDPFKFDKRLFGLTT